MWADPIVEETRKLREEYSAEFGHDVDALARDLKQKEQQRGRKLVSFRPRRPAQSAPDAA
jgi:hypothetical protein